ncbi:MAG: type II secretion system ATPase GspE [bacterium]
MKNKDNRKIPYLTEILIEEGSLTQEMADECLELQKERKEMIGKLLISMGYIDEERLYKALSKQHKIPYIDLKEEEIDPDLLKNLPFNFVKKYLILPIKMEGQDILVATCNALDLHPLDDLRLLFNRPVRPILCKESKIEFLINKFYSQQNTNSAEEVLKDLSDQDINVEDLDAESQDLLSMANEAPIIQVVNNIFMEAVHKRASDIHVEPLDDELRVRLRIDGVLYNILNLERKFQSSIISRIKIMSKLNIAEKRLPQDGITRVKIGNKFFDIRVSIIPTSLGERAVMRLLDRESIMIDMEQLGLDEREYKKINDIIESPNGIFLVTGPTGAGKTTTLYAALNKINTIDKNIITVEDPVEYQLRGIAQMEMKSKIGLTFASGLRSILRHDPDIIMVGEIRDSETAEIAIHASLTGHLVFSTLHTNDSSGAVARLIDMGIEPFLVSSSLIAIMAQRLVRKLCDNCKEEYTPEGETLSLLKLKKKDIIDYKLYKNVGCKECANTGYKGRLGVYELLIVDNDIRKLIITRADSSQIKNLAVSKGMRSLKKAGLRKVLKGVTSIEEVLRTL